MTKFSVAQRFGLTRVPADERYRAGLAAFAARDAEKAIQELRAALELLPKHAEYHAALGFLLLNDKRQREASESFERALGLNPYEMLASYGLGIIDYRSKRWLDALRRFTVAHAAQPNRAETMYYLAMACHRLGRNEEAAGWMERAASEFHHAGDRRESQCQAWQREFQRLLAGK